ncbi:MAG: hypothetical protein SAMD01599839_25190 [Rectinema sp.]
MDRIIAISDTVNAGIHSLVLAEMNGGSVSARQVAERLGVSPTYLAKIMQKLAARGLLVPSRGLGGGYALVRSATEISCLDVLDALEGDLPKRECLFTRSVCRTKTCALRAFCEETDTRLRRVLAATTIAAVARSF